MEVKTNLTIEEGENGEWEFDHNDTGFIIIVILFSIIGVGACLMWWFLCRNCQCNDRLSECISCLLCIEFLSR